MLGMISHRAQEISPRSVLLRSLLAWVSLSKADGVEIVAGWVSISGYGTKVLDVWVPKGRLPPSLKHSQATRPGVKVFRRPALMPNEMRSRGITRRAAFKALVGGGFIPTIAHAVRRSSARRRPSSRP